MGDEVAEMVNPTEFTQHFERVYQSQPYYSQDYTWKDYAPAYQYGYAAYGHYPDRNFNEVESELRQEWEETKLDTRLQWNEARDAVKDGWNYVKNRVDAMDGEIDRRTY